MSNLKVAAIRLAKENPEFRALLLRELESTSKVADSPYDWLEELESTPQEQEAARKEEVERFIRNDLLRASLELKGRNGISKWRSARGGKWPSSKNPDPALYEVFSLHTMQALRDLGVLLPKLPSNIPVTLFFDSEDRKENGTIGRVYTGYGFIGPDRKRHYLAKGKSISSATQVLEALSKFLKDRAKKVRVASSEKQAMSVGKEIFRSMVDMRELGKARSQLRKAGDDTTYALMLEVMEKVISELEPKNRGVGRAINRLSGIKSSSNPEMIRNQVFKAADELGIRLPHSHF